MPQRNAILIYVSFGSFEVLNIIPHGSWLMAGSLVHPATGPFTNSIIQMCLCKYN